MRGYREISEMRVVGRLEKEIFKGCMGRILAESRERESSKTKKHEKRKRPLLYKLNGRL